MNGIPPLTGLAASFFERDPAAVARDLLGTWLVHYTPEGAAGGVIVEAEAYRGDDDPASHAHRGPTPRNRVMFEECGRAYVYFIYGNHYCLNVVAHPPDRAGAVLLRALEPRAGLDLMSRRRGRDRPVDLASGPGKLCQALGVDRRHNGTPFRRPTGECGLVLGRAAQGPPLEISVGPRIGVRAGAAEPLRFWAVGNRHVSLGERG